MHPKKTAPQWRMWHTVVAVGFAWAFVWVSGSVVKAHNVSVFAWVEGSTVHVESKFSGGRRPKNAPIEVYDRLGSLLVKGETDDQGKFFFQIPRRTEMKIVLQAGMGHKAEWIIPVEDLEGIDPGVAAQPAAIEKQGPIDPAPSQPPDTADLTGASSASANPTGADIERVVEKVLDKKLRPVMKLLAESRQTGPDLRDILGGLGYIIGLVGLAAYLRHRRSKQSSDSSAADKQPPAPTEP